MEDPPEPLNILLELLWIGGFSIELVLGCLVLIALLFCSAVISGAEVAFFSLSKSQLEEMMDSDNRYRKEAVVLLNKPKRLLATILVANNFVNVGIVILSTYLVGISVPSETLNYLLGGIIPIGRVIEVFGITLIVLLFGEIIPKVYANEYAVRFSSAMSFPIRYMSGLFIFLTAPLIKLTSIIDKRMGVAQNNLSVDELTLALELTSAHTIREKEDRKILEGIVKFGNTNVKQIMKPRTDVEAMDKNLSYPELVAAIRESGYSRVAIYQESLDNILGIVHIKDFLPYMDEGEDFDWHHLIREPFFVPESKMIDDLLEEFREKKVHIAIVVDEYGGCEGLVTLEDIIEEIVGDISDEFDEEEVVYSKLDDDNYVFEGKTNLKQFYRVIKIDGVEFEKHKGEADTLAGFILEVAGQMPTKNQQFVFSDFEFTVESVDKRRVKRIKVTRKQQEDQGESAPVGTIIPFILLLLSFGLSGCDQDYTPKPRGYVRIDLPEKSYQIIETDCPFEFESSTYSNLVQDKKVGAEPCWFNIEYPKYKAKWHFSYKPLYGNLSEYLEESRSLTNKHMSKASAIDEVLIIRPDANVYGAIYAIEGSQAASPFQIYLTDSTDHFLRAALYFHVSPNNDSLAPVIDYLREDMLHLIETLRWKP